jgi:hypothetical protein
MPDTTDTLFRSIKTLGDLARLPSDASPVPPMPDLCSRCGGALSLSWEMHSFGADSKGYRRTWWIAWASCPECQLFFVRNSPPQSPEEHGWRLEPDPPEFVVDPDWAAPLRRAAEQAPRRPFRPVPAHAFGFTLSALGLSAPVIKCLECQGMLSVADICVRSSEELLEIHNFGERQLHEVRERLASLGLALQDG